MQQEFKYLFTPLKIGSITVPGRIFLPAHSTFYYPPFGEPNERAINYWQARAKGGARLIITAPHWVFWPSSAETSHGLRKRWCYCLAQESGGCHSSTWNEMFFSTISSGGLWRLTSCWWRLVMGAISYAKDTPI